MINNLESIPEGWKLARLGEVAEKIGDGLHGTPNYSRDGSYCFINGNNIENGKIEIKGDTKKVDREEYHKYKKDLGNNTLLLSINGTIGNLAKYRNEKCILGKSAAYITIKSDTNQDFIYYLMMDHKFQYNISKNANGSTIKNVSLEQLRNYSFLLPPLPEQKAIAEVLTSLDNKIELLREQNQTLEAIAQAIFKEWFVNFNFPTVGGKPYRSSGGTLIDSELGPIPEGWRIGDFYDSIFVDYGFPFSSDRFNDKKIGLPLIRIRDLIDGNPEIFTDEACPINYIVSPGDILAGMDAEFRAVVWKGKQSLLNQRVCRFRPKENIGHIFVLEMIKPHLNFFEKTKFGTTVSHLNKTDLDSIETIVPPITLILTFSELTESMYHKMILINNQIQTLSTLRYELLPKLMKGELRIKGFNKI